MAMEQIAGAIRLKQIRANPITYGRAMLRLFEVAPEGERPHPRLRTAFVEHSDPAPPSLPAIQAWANAGAFREWLTAALGDAQLHAGLDSPPAGASPRYWQNSLRARRVTALLDHARAAVDQRQDWAASERATARYALAELGALAYAGVIVFDDEDTGTYHSYLNDEPFVHVLEALRGSLPVEGSEAFALLPAEQQYAIRRQHTQLTHHIDHIMRFKYALQGIVETDIERSLGGFLIDRVTRQIVSEDPATLATLRPRYQLLRIDPASQHPHAGAWVMRTTAGLALRDGTPVSVPEQQLLRVEVPASRLTFERALHDPHLRADVRFDWDGDGWIDAQAIEWVAWAGHCDVKAVLEQLGLALLEQPSVREYRSDTGRVAVLSRDLLLELLTAVVELGSVYTRLDGSGLIVRGIHHFGGARNDELPDRLQFAGLGPGQHFRWPLSRAREAFQVTRIRDAGEELDLDVTFSRCIADAAAVDFVANPRYLGTVEGDYNIISATGMHVTASVRIHAFDSAGRLVQTTQQIDVDLRPGAVGRTFLGTHLHDAGARELYRVYLDRAQPAAVAELWRWDPNTGQEVHLPNRDVVVPLASPLSTTLSREASYDDPALFQALIGLALQRGENICADTHLEAPVWNGVVTRMQAERITVNAAARVERWRVRFWARYGLATLDYLVRRASDGTPVAYCPIVGTGTLPPDFLWQDLPDIASKGIEAGAWVVNRSMRDRGIVSVQWEPQEQGGWYVEDDHIKNSFELLYAALAGYRFTIVHQNKRYVFESEAAWAAARAQLDALRTGLSFE
jgi:hypothetical protein